MALDTNLINAFAEQVTSAEDMVDSGEYYNGTVKIIDGKNYVQIDGSSTITPVAVSSVGLKDGNRVSCTIKDHRLSVIANMSDPSVNKTEVDEISTKIIEVNTLLAEKVSTKDFEAKIADIENLKADKATIEDLKADMLTVDSADIRYAKVADLEATDARIDNLKAGMVTADDIAAKYATIENLKATNETVTNLQGTYATFEKTVTEELKAKQAAIDKLDADKLNANDADIKYATIKNLDAAKADISDLSAKQATFESATAGNFTAVNADIENLRANKMDVDTANAKFANIDFANITEAAVKKIFSDSGIIKDLIVSEGKITGELVGVTIKGDLIEGGTVIADKLVVKGSNGLYYKLNTDGVTTEAEQTEYNSLNGSVITAKSITATKIAVDDLVAFGATIAGYTIKDHALYSGAKTSATNGTRGVYMNDDGEFSVGDASNFIRFWKDTDGKYKLAISAQSITMSSSGKSVESAINSAQTAADNAASAASKAQTTANDAATAAGKAQSTANEANTAASNAQNTADKANTAASNAQTTANSATTAASNAKTAADAAQTTANSAVSKADAAQSKADTTAIELTEWKTSYTQDMSGFKQTVEKTYATKSTVDQLQNIADAAIETWTGNGVPTTSNLPASKWNTDALKKQHSGDIYYDNDTGYSYRFGSSDGTVYSWTRIKDSDITSALNKADAAQTTANSATTAASNAQTTADKAQTTANNANTAAGKAQTTADNAQKNLDDYKGTVANTYVTKTTFEQTASSITSKVETAQTTANSAATAASEAKQSAEEVSLNLSKNYSTTTDVNKMIDDISVGGRNILRNTRAFTTSDDSTGYLDSINGCFSHNRPMTDVSGYENGMYVRGGTIASTDDHVRYMIKNCTPGQIYTFSFKCRASSNIKIRTFFYGPSGYITAKPIGFWTGGDYATSSPYYGDGAINHSIPASTTTTCWVSYELDPSGTATDKMIMIRTDFSSSVGATLNVWGLKLELGNKATDWTPAPEDLQPAGDYATKTELKATSDSITASVSKVETVANNASSAASKAQTTANNANTAASNAQNTANTANSTANTANTKIDNLKVGGRNLLKNTYKFRPSTPYIISGKKQDIYVYERSIASTISVQNGIPYIFQCQTDGIWSKTHYGSDGADPSKKYCTLWYYDLDNIDGYVHTIDLSNGPASVTFNNPNATDGYFNLAIRFNTYSNGTDTVTVKFWDLKMEQGTTATDWTPAPEDLATTNDVEEAKSYSEAQLKILSDNISTLVTDAAGKSMMKQTSSGWTFDMSQIQNGINANANQITSVSGDLSNISKTVDDINTNVKSLLDTSAYISIGQDDDGNPRLELGKKDSPFRVAISNTSIDFLEGTDKIAYISNKQLYIYSSVVTDELKIGDSTGYIWKRRANNHLGLRYVTS